MKQYFTKTGVELKVIQGDKQAGQPSLEWVFLHKPEKKPFFKYINNKHQFYLKIGFFEYNSEYVNPKSQCPSCGGRHVYVQADETGKDFNWCNNQDCNAAWYPDGTKGYVSK